MSRYFNNDAGVHTLGMTELQASIVTFASRIDPDACWAYDNEPDDFCATLLCTPAASVAVLSRWDGWTEPNDPPTLHTRVVISALR